MEEKPKVMNLQLMSSFNSKEAVPFEPSKDEDEGTGESSVSYHAAGGDVPVITQSPQKMG